MAPFKIPKITLNNKLSIPVLGLGTWKAKSKEVIKAVTTAIDLGYRHIDCALVYENEPDVGKAIQSKIKDKVIGRNDLFITGKLWNTFHRPDLVEDAIKTSLCNLKLDYLDLYLIHWPMAYREGHGLFPMFRNKALHSHVHYNATWKAMEELVRKGYTKSIGVSNFNVKQLDDVLRCACIKPVTNQVECHPYLNQERLLNYCKANQIILTAYSPLGSPDRPWANTNDPILLEDKKILCMAKRFSKTPAQILLRYQIDRGNVVIPKSVTPSRIKENMEIFDFSFTCKEIQQLNALNCGRRYVALAGDSNHPHYPFTECFN
ncbi:hypothetical protein ILUMI_08199 [Ignelater luminosus]|uniref:NADP-dependent oxidoreductase domain-containing protein n=1 Tax=Ignelater luminosus TaxID=2038154 RepID=A0A8K0D7B5_IGNLU|nr:hypothetical protein ILUMI_08199 [Ignelater luminosus]